MNSSASPLRRLFIVLAVLLWTLLLVGGYFWAHKPFEMALVAAVGRTAGNVAVWLLLCGVGLLVGLRLDRLGERDEVGEGGVMAGERPFVRVALATGLGLGVLGVLVGVLGLVGLLQGWVVWVLLLVLVLLCRPVWGAAPGEVRAVGWPRPENGLERWFLLFAVTSLALTFIYALLPPTAWDSLVYHLTGPKLYMEAGRVSHALDLPYLGFPPLGQMQFLAGMLLWGDGVAALLHFGYGLLTLAVMAGLAREAFGRRAAWFAVVILLAVPTLHTLLSWPYVDVTLTFYATAAFYAFYRWRRTFVAGRAGTGWLLLIGVFCGFGGGLKYTAVIVPAALALSVVWTLRRAGAGVILRALLLVALPAGLLVVPWLVENWLTTGNPVYPFFLDEALYWDAWRGWWYDRPGTGLAATAPWRLLIVPLEATILGTEGSNFYDATIGPLLLLSGGLLVLVWRALEAEEKAVAGHMLVFVVVSYLFWLNGVARSGLLFQTRLLLPVFGVAAGLGGVALKYLPVLRRPQLDLNWIVLVFFNLTLGLTLFAQVVAFLVANPWPVLLGAQTREGYLERTLGAHYEAMATINGLPTGSQVLFLWEPRSYYCEAGCHPDALLDRWLHHTHYLELEAAQIAGRWQEEGITHVLLFQQGLELIVEAGFDPVTPADLDKLETLVNEHLQESGRWGDAYVLYEWIE